MPIEPQLITVFGLNCALLAHLQIKLCIPQILSLLTNLTTNRASHLLNNWWSILLQISCTILGIDLHSFRFQSVGISVRIPLLRPHLHLVFSWVLISIVSTTTDRDLISFHSRIPILLSVIVLCQVQVIDKWVANNKPPLVIIVLCSWLATIPPEVSHCTVILHFF